LIFENPEIYGERPCYQSGVSVFYCNSAVIDFADKCNLL